MPFLSNQIITRLHQPPLVDFISGVVMLIDKPKGWTSFDVVNKLRFKLKHGLKVKKIKVGHAGTLDPMATGLLLVCTGKLTKEIDLLQAEIKGYTGTMFLGATTPTYDAESEPDAFFQTDHISINDIEKAVAALTGPLQQIPPVYSAIKIEGKASYELARRGKEVEMKPRPVEIYKFDILNKDRQSMSFYASCSKGTYIRSLVYDFGELLNSGAYLNGLRRVSIGEFSVDDALTVEDASAYIDTVCGVGSEKI
ncbi:MAG: tRNA pseudouridine(55) synthase TruB [Saprospiraceae bacterium]|nr:tRNA pseudouridine(55) synthase TruB [Saprospiraceae bacterium]